LRVNQGSYGSYKLLALLYLKQGNTGRSHIQSAKALVTQGKFDKAIGHYQRAKALARVVTNGLFANSPADVLLLGTPNGVRVVTA
jgi:predicted Zn-dependent protease